MAEFFDVDLVELNAYAVLNRAKQYQLRQAVGRQLNAYATMTRETIIDDTFPDLFDMRQATKGLIKNTMRAEFANFNQPIASMQSSTYSRNFKRSGGFESQQKGQAPKGVNRFAKRRPTLAARRGNKRNRMLVRARLKGDITQAHELPRGNFKRTDRDWQSIIGAQMLNRQGSKDPFIIRDKDDQLKYGLYAWDKKKLNMLQSFEGGIPSVKRYRWMDKAVSTMFRKANIDRIWWKSLKAAKVI